MIFDVFRFQCDATATVTSADRHDAEKVRAALASPNCIGVVEKLDARNRWDAMDRAKPRFEKFDCALGERGRQLRERKGGAS